MNRHTMKKIAHQTILFSILLFGTLSFAQDVTFTNTFIGPSILSGVVDLNGDYLDDIFVPQNNAIKVYYQTDTGFDEVSIPITPTYLPEWTVAVADFDSNGINDVMYASSTGVSFFRANEDGTNFIEAYASIDTDPIVSQRGNFIDINNDGDLDAFMCHDTEANVYFLNDNNGSFLPEIQGGLGDTDGGGDYGSIWFDYDGDKDMDLYISKCYFLGGELTDPKRINQLHRNNGDGTFTDVAPEAGVDIPSQGWSTAVGDFDNDGDMDLVVADQHVGEVGTKVMVNNGDGTFTDQTTGSGLGGLDGSVTITTFDFNNDGFLDIYLEVGARLYLGNGDLTFSPNLQQPPQRGSVGDANNDGFLDIYRGNNLRVNGGNDNNWLKINLKGVESNYNGIGAIITIESVLGTQTRHVRSGEGFLNAHSIIPHFGLGADNIVGIILVEWPSGEVDLLENIDVNQGVFIEEGSFPILSISENKKDTMILYPVPANDRLHIMSSEKLNTKVIITSNTGAVSFANIKEGTIDIHYLAAGTYSITSETLEGIKITKQFTKQ
jgi:hypothetical protein